MFMICRKPKAPPALVAPLQPQRLPHCLQSSKQQQTRAWGSCGPIVQACAIQQLPELLAAGLCRPSAFQSSLLQAKGSRR